MKGLRFLGNKKAEMQTFPDPVAKGDNVVVKVKSSALCGTDLPFYRAPDGLDFIPGHEISGEVFEIDKTKYIKKGDRVTINTQVGCGRCDSCRKGKIMLCGNQVVIGLHKNGGHCEYVLAPEKNIFLLPDEISYETGAVMHDGLGVPYHNARRLGVSAFDTVAVFGTGPIGLGFVIMLKFLGAIVIAVEINDYRLKLAKDLGADYVVDAKSEDPVKFINDLTKNRGVDIAVDSAAHTDVTLNQVIACIKKAGTIGVVGQKGEMQVTIHPRWNNISLWDKIILNEVQILGSCGYDYGEHGNLINLVQRGVGIEKMVTHRFSLEQAPEAYRLFDQGNTGKVVINQ